MVYDLPNTLEDGDSIEWYHQDGSYGVGIVANGVTKTNDLVDHNVDNSSNWDLLAPITGTPTNSNGQNFGNNFSPSPWVGMVPIGWDDNTNPQSIPTSPVYSSSDVWKLYNDNGTIKLLLNNVLFRTSISTYTNPTITFAVPDYAAPNSEISTSEFPTFIHTENSASAPTGFTLVSGTMDTSTLLNGDSVAFFDNFEIAIGQRLIVPKSWADTYVLPHFDGDSGEDNKVFIGVPKGFVNWSSVDFHTDFYAVHSWENEGVNSTKMGCTVGGSSNNNFVTRNSDTDSFFNMAIDFSREGNLTVIRSSDTQPSLTTEPIIGGTFGVTEEYTNFGNAVSDNSLRVYIATKSAESRALLSATNISVITSPLPSNQFDVTEDSTTLLPLFNGADAESSVTLVAGLTYKFWLHSDTLTSNNQLSICLSSDNTEYSTGVTTFGTVGSFGAYLEFAVPTDAPPIKFKWISGGNPYYATPSISGSTYSETVTGVTHEGSATISGTEVTADTWYSIDETLSAGERIVFNGSFFQDVFDELGDTTSFIFGVKDGSWVNTLDGNSSSSALNQGFEYDLCIKFYKSNFTGGTLRVLQNNSTQVTLISYTSVSVSTLGAFIEITSNGNNIRMGVTANTTTDVPTTTTYTNWSSAKGQTGDQSYGISSRDVMAFYDRSSNSNPFDYANIDWTELSEVSVPVATNIDTDWNKALDFSGGNEYAIQVNSATWTTPMLMSGLATTVNTHSDLTKTSNLPTARPWSCSTVFKVDGNSSNQHIWNVGEGASNNDDNMYLRVDANLYLRFGWGREGVGYNEIYLGQLSSSNWYGLYICSKGQRFSATDATASNLAGSFDIRLMSSSDSFNAVGSNLSTLSNWSASLSSTGARMTRGISGSLTIGGRGNNRNFHGKVAAFLATTLIRDVSLPIDSVIKLIITDPIKWLNDYKIGNPYRSPSGSNATNNFQINNVGAGYRAIQLWLMGDGTNDSYSNHIRNQTFSQDQNITKLQLNNMASNDIENVTISGLS